MVRGGSVRAGAAALAIVLMAGAWAGCALLNGGRVSIPAQYKFGKTRRVLVLVEMRDGVAPPPAFATNLADKLGGLLWQKKALGVPPVPQDRLINLQQSNPDAYKNLGIEDIAKETGADNVLRIYITQLQATTTTDGNVAEGNAEAYVKVIDNKGIRQWPGDTTGTRITAHADVGLLTDRSIAETINKLADQLSENTAHLFYEYTPERHNMPN